MDVRRRQDFLDGKLPSFDTKIWVLDAHTMVSNLMMEENYSALSHVVKMATLSEEVTRRQKNTSLEVDVSTRMEILDRA